MDKNEHDKIIAFDTLFTNNHIQMLKIVMPYFDEPFQKNLAVYIKYQELRYTLAYYTSHPHELYGCSVKKEEFNVNKICSEILPFCTNEEKQMIEQVAGLFRSMEMYKEMSKTFEMMKDFMPDFSPESLLQGFGGNFPFDSSSDNKKSTGSDSISNNTNQNNGMMDMLMGMLSPEQKAMFEMFGGKHESE